MNERVDDGCRSITHMIHGSRRWLSWWMMVHESSPHQLVSTPSATGIPVVSQLCHGNVHLPYDVLILQVVSEVVVKDLDDITCRHFYHSKLLWESIGFLSTWAVAADPQFVIPWKLSPEPSQLLPICINEDISLFPSIYLIYLSTYLSIYSSFYLHSLSWINAFQMVSKGR